MLTRTTCYCNVDENKIKQYFAAQIVQCCQQYCSPMLHLIQAQQYFTFTRVKTHKQWRSQPDNLVPLCKFEIIIIIQFFRN